MNQPVIAWCLWPIALFIHASCNFPRPPDVACAKREDCAAGQMCESSTGNCVAETSDAGSGCVLDDECASRVCQADGVCAAAENVLYVAIDGIAAGDCAAATPCELFYARSRVTPNRATLRLGNGRYDLATSFVVDGSSGDVALVGTRNAILQQPRGSAIVEVKDGTTFTVRGISISRPIQCIDSTVNVARVSFSNPLTAGQSAWLNMNGCSTSVVDSDLVNSSSNGILASRGELTVVRARISGSTESGIFTTAKHTTIIESSIGNNNDLGMRAGAGDSVVSIQRSIFFSNFRGGVMATGGIVNIANNFIYRNGNPNDAGFGGLYVDTTLPGNRIVHNTIVRNTASPSNASNTPGFFCRGGGSFINNLIANNFSGITSTTQVAGTCDLSGSQVANTDTAAHFVSADTVPYNYHLADTASEARNAGIAGPAPATEDFDGEPRKDRAPDVGADELSP